MVNRRESDGLPAIFAMHFDNFSLDKNNNEYIYLELGGRRGCPPILTAPTQLIPPAHASTLNLKKSTKSDKKRIARNRKLLKSACPKLL